VTIDHDPAVVALGHKRGHEAILADFLTLDWNSLRDEFDGLFVRHSIAAQRFDEPVSLAEFANRICSVLKPGGWGWVYPWNRFRDKASAHVEPMLAAQRQAFERKGFAAFELTPLFAQAGGIRDRRDLFLRDLDPGSCGLNPRRLGR
jgi:hypothetical protein